MLTRKTPETFTRTINFIVMDGSKVPMTITYHNVRPSVLDDEAKERSKPWTDDELVLRVVKEWDAEFPLTQEGMKELMDLYPGVVRGVAEGFFRGRVVELEKN